MKIRLLLALALVVWAGAAHAQTALVIPTCGSITIPPDKNFPLYQDVTGALCVGGISVGSVTATTAATAAATPTAVLAGTGKPLYIDLFSALYVKPTYGNGTAVDATHGLPVNIVAGGGTYDAAFPASGYAAGLSDGTNLKSWLAAIALGDGVNGNNTGATAGWLWNGTTYDRARGDLTNGAYVNVKTSVLPTNAATSGNQTTANTALGAPGDSVCGTATGTCSIEALIKFLNNAATSATPAGTALIGNVGTVAPAGSTQITASTTGTTAATTATLAGTSGKTTYVCGFSIRANATAAATANSTVTGTITGTLNYTQWTAPLASGIGITEQIFQPCVPASATNTGIAVISAAPGSGGVVSVTAWGFQL